MIKKLLNSVITKYHDLPVSRRSIIYRSRTIICLSLRLRQIIELLAIDKSRYFAQPRPIIDHFTVVGLVTWLLNGSEAGGDLVLIQTSTLLLCKSRCSYAN